MAKATIQKYTCDRCGGVDEMRRDGQSYEWGAILAMHENGPFRIAKGHKPAPGFPANACDICPTCCAELSKWWENPHDH